MSVFELREALGQPGCAVCRLSARAADHFVESLLWEGVNDPERREELRRSQGFCHKHAWSLVRTGASLGSAIIMRDLVEHALKVMANAASRAGPPWLLRRIVEALNPAQPASATADLVAQLGPRASCPACVWAEKMERIYIDALLDSLLDESEGEVLAAFEASDGLCLSHLRQALARARGRRLQGALLDAQRGIWERLVGDLSEFVRKNDYRFQHEEMGEERNAWIRGIAAIAGARPDEDMRK